MSRRTQLKLKKILKKAEFVHADLEYHEEMLIDAKKEFHESFTNLLKSLPPDIKQKIEENKKKQLEENLRRQQEELDKAEKENNKPDDDRKKGTVTDLSPDVVSDSIEDPVEIEDQDSEVDKSSIIKKLFYKIANLTHPDKLVASNLPEHEVNKRKETFKRAQTAYERNNWYTLYSIATDFGIDPGEVGNDQIAWIEDDIKLTMNKISNIARLFAWVWYTAPKADKEMIMKNYFAQVYGVEY
tara:strand:+ start:248 stop:973 length:726 start_codon:yes stop_codon:yes gene_type:complete